MFLMDSATTRLLHSPLLLYLTFCLTSPHLSYLLPIRIARFSRRSHGFDYPEQPEVDKYYPQFYHKQDREGRPIYIEQLGKLDINKLYALTTQERQLKHLVGEYEKFFKDRLPACSAEKGELVETSCTILDLYNAGISSFYKGECGGVAAGRSGGDRTRLEQCRVGRARRARPKERRGVWTSGRLGLWGA
jgi:hypothetical protein